MATPNYTPTPVDPASTNPAPGGTPYGVSLADDGEPLRAGIFSAADEDLLDRIRWLRDNSALLAGTYTVSASVTRTGPTIYSGSNATTAWRTFTLPPVNTNITIAADEYKQGGVLAGVLTHIIKSTGPGTTPSNGMRIRVVKGVSAFDVVLIREGGIEIATMPAAMHSIVEVTYYLDETKWRLTGAFQVDLTTATP